MMTAIFLLACLVGSVIQTVSGFGFGIFVQTIFPFVLPSTGVGVAISSMLTSSSSSLVMFRLRHRIDFKAVIPSLLGFFSTSAAVIFFFAGQPDHLIRKMLAVVLVLMSVYFLFFSSKIKIKPTILNGVIAGMLSGTLGGLFGISGPPMVVFLLSAFGDDSEKYMANIQFFFTLTGLYSTIMRVVAGLIDWYVVSHWMMGLAAVFLGVYIGRKIFAKISVSTLRKLVYGFMAASGIFMLFQ